MKNKWKIAGIAMLGVVVIAFCVWSLLRPADRNDTPGTQDSSTADTPVSQPDSTESSDSGVTADSAAQDESPLSAPGAYAVHNRPCQQHRQDRVRRAADGWGKDAA